jgi:hypothetical protein
MLASIPAPILNHIGTNEGIPRFSQARNRYKRSQLNEKIAAERQTEVISVTLLERAGGGWGSFAGGFKSRVGAGNPDECFTGIVQGCRGGMVRAARTGSARPPGGRCPCSHWVPIKGALCEGGTKVSMPRSLRDGGRGPPSRK